MLGSMREWGRDVRGFEGVEDVRGYEGVEDIREYEGVGGC